MSKEQMAAIPRSSHEPVYPVRVWAVGYVDGPCDWLMSDGSIQTLKIGEAAQMKSDAALAEVYGKKVHSR